MKKEINDAKIKVRRINFGHEKTEDRYWYGGSVFMTHFLNALHLIFPEGERFFIRTVKHYEKAITDPSLIDRVKGFIGQEVQHGSQHTKFYDTLRDQGFDVDSFIRWYRTIAYEDMIEPFLRGIVTPEAADRGALAVTAAMEHYTATLAEIVLKDPEFFLSEVADDMKHMLMWHAAEEIEHKAVAYDVYEKSTNNSYPMRILGFAIATTSFYFFIASGWAWFFMNDKEWKWTQLPQDAVKVAPMLGKLGWGFLKLTIPYLSPGFHPNDIKNEHLAKDFFEKEKKYFDQRIA